MEEPQTERHRERSRKGLGVSRRPSWFETAGETLSFLVSGWSADCFSASLSQQAFIPTSDSQTEQESNRDLVRQNNRDLVKNYFWWKQQSLYRNYWKSPHATDCEAASHRRQLKYQQIQVQPLSPRKRTYTLHTYPMHHKYTTPTTHSLCRIYILYISPTNIPCITHISQTLHIYTHTYNTYKPHMYSTHTLSQINHTQRDHTGNVFIPLGYHKYIPYEHRPHKHTTRQTVQCITSDHGSD